MDIFVDSSGWISLFGKADKHHIQSRTAFQALQGQPLNWYTSDYVFDESLTFLRKKYGTHIAIKCGQTILNASFITFLRVDEFVWQEAWQMFQSYEDKDWAFTDCTSFVLMRHHQLWQAFSFDAHFVQAGFQLWPETHN